MRRGSAREGYTLLEMTLALAIALIILGAVYEFLNRQITLSEIGRDLVEESSLARGILDRMSADISGHLGGIDPQQLPGAPSGDSTDAVVAAESFVPLFNNGLEGSDTLMILSAARVPRELLASDKRKLDSSQLTTVSDLRRISYWLVQDGNTTGLARQEISRATSGDMDTKPPDLPNANDLIFAPEVKSVLFEYFDGSTWQSTWSGSSLAADGQTPIGPPAAVRITLTLKSKDGKSTRDYKHVVALPAGNNFLAQQLGT